jgi:hypothetical protein
MQQLDELNEMNRLKQKSQHQWDAYQAALKRQAPFAELDRLLSQYRATKEEFKNLRRS